MSFTDFKFILKCSRHNFVYDKPISPEKTVWRFPHLLFVSTESKNLSVHQTADEIFFSYGSKQLAFLELKWNSKNKILTIDIDQFGLANLFYIQQGENIFVSNTTLLLEQNIKLEKLSVENILFFLTSGFLPVGRSFWQDIHKVEHNMSFDLNQKTKFQRTSGWQSRFLEPSEVSEKKIIENVIGSVTDGLKEIHNYYQPTELRLSGGIDSRLVSVLWPFQALNTTVVQSPWVADGEDLDVNLSQAWSEHLNWPHKILKPTHQEFGFFTDSQGKNILTGLCGGEFLGGQFHRVIQTSPEQWKPAAEEIFPEKNFDFIQEDPWFQEVSSNPEKWLSECVRIYLQSMRTTLYSSIQAGWDIPFQMHSKYLSPFVTPQFLKVFLNIPLDVIGDYYLYQKIFLTLKNKLDQVPLCSQITDRIPEMKADALFGANPKSRVTTNTQATSPEMRAERLSNLLAHKSIYISQQDLMRMLMNSKYKIRVLSLLRWMDERFKIGE